MDYKKDKEPKLAAKYISLFAKIEFISIAHYSTYHQKHCTKSYPEGLRFFILTIVPRARRSRFCFF